MSIRKFQWLACLSLVCAVQTLAQPVPSAVPGRSPAPLPNPTAGTGTHPGAGAVPIGNAMSSSGISAPGAGPSSSSSSVSPTGAGPSTVLPVQLPTFTFSVSAGQYFQFTLPKDVVFRSLNWSKELSVRASLISAPLPVWIRFDPAAATFYGTAPKTEPFVLNVYVTARDAAGKEVSTEVLFRVL